MKTRINAKLVFNGNQILCGLLNKRIHKNQTIRETGFSKKVTMLEIFPFLLKGNFINIEKDKKIHKQKEFLVLTEFGHKWATFVNTINQFEIDLENIIKNKEDSFDRYQSIFANTAIGNYISDINDNNNNNKEKTRLNALSVRDNLLREKGWSSDEIPKFEMWQCYTHKFIYYIIDFVIEIIIDSYHKFLMVYEINEYADKFILTFTENKASFYIKKKIELRNNEIGINIKDKDADNNILLKRLERNSFLYSIFEKHKEILFGEFGDLILPNLDNNRIKYLLQKISQNIIFMIDINLNFFETELDEMEKDNKLLLKDYLHDEKKNQLIIFYKSLLR